MRTKNRRAEMGTWFLLVVLLISSTASLEKIVCEKPSPPQNGEVYLTDNSQEVGSQIEYICDEHHVMEPIDSKFAICTVHGHWSSPQPRCIRICNVRALSNGSIRDIFGRKMKKNSFVLDNTELIFTCYNGYEKYASGYEPRGRLKCVDGALHPGSPECRPQRCFIEPTTNLELFIREEKVLENYIHSGIVVNARCSNRTELFRSSSYLERERVYVKCYLGKLELELPVPVCKDKRCNIITTIDNGHFINSRKVVVTGEKILPGSNIKLICFEGYELYNKTNSMYLDLEQTDIKCYQGSFTSETSSCEPKRCFIEPTTNLEYFIGQERVLENYIHSGIVVNARCSNRTELFGLSSYLEREQVNVKCNLGKLEPESPVCKDKRCDIITTIDNGHFRNRGKVVVTGEKILSGSNIKLICFDGYELYNKTNSMYLDLEQTDIKCYQGSFTPEIPSCEPKRCLIEPPVNMQYFIEGKKVLHKYIENGTIMQARCPDRMELVLSSSYLDNEQIFVQCILGTLEPRTLECKGSYITERCNITQIHNGKLVKGENVINPRDMIGSNSNITLVCYDGFELYNESISMYLESQKTDILCYQGSFNVAYLKCNPKRCHVDRSLFLLPEVHYVEHGQYLNVHCPDNMELHNEGNYQKLEETSVFCSKGIWSPTLPMCIKKMCKTIDVAREITGFIVSETKTKPGEFVPHNESIQIVCDEGYRSHGILTCNAGIWMGNSTCELDVTGCVLKDPGMHFISLGNRTVLNVGENANVSCKFGYQIVSNISATPADQYYYGASESTADPSEMSETEDNKNLIAVSDGNYTCRDSGKWEPEIRFSCKQMCQTIDVAREITGFIVSETKTTPGEFVPHNQSIETVCGEGYRRHGVLTCNAGIWMGNSTCEPDVTRCVLKERGMHFISLGNRTELQVGENAKVSCKFGYQIVPIISAKGSYEYNYPDSESTADPSEMQETEDNENLITVSDRNYTCIDNGKWKPEIRFSCTQIMCDSFDKNNLENGNIIYSTHDGYSVGTVVSFQCNPGYTRHGPENRTCQIDGTWSGQCVTCQRDGSNASITCPAPCVPVGARKTGSFTYEIGSKVEISCTRSKTQDGGDRRIIKHCIKNGEYASWNGTMINCKEIICAKGDHYGFENGKVTYSSSVTTVFTEASFTCNPGYNLHGPMIRICQKNGTWSGECVTCQKHQPNSSTCPAPCIPDGAIRNGSLSDEIGSRIQLYCFESNMNYSVENSYIRHCVNDGKSASWNGTNINCKAKCKPLTDTYKVVKTGVVPGILSDKTVVELICNGSLEEVRAECRNGHWHPKKPTCKSKCEPLSDTYKVVKTGVLPRILSDKTVVELNCTGSLAKVQAECRNGQWHPKKPTCKLADTCSLSAVEGTLYNYKETKEKVFQGPIKSDRQIKVTCKDGFLPNTQNYDVSRCVNGVWKPEIVKCEKTDNF